MIAGMPKSSHGIASTIDDNASAVTIPGNAIGNTSANEIASRPKKVARAIAKEASDPSTSAITVAMMPTTNELMTGSRNAGLCHAVVNHDVVAHLVALPRVGWALLQFVDRPDAGRILLWLALSAVVHDFVLLPFYSVLDRAGLKRASPRRW